MKKALIIVCSVICIFLIIVAVYYLVPEVTKLNQTLHTVKLDANGNKIGSADIAMQGYWQNYRLWEDSHELYITPFDGLGSIVPSDNGKGTGGYTSTLGEDYLQAVYGVHNSVSNSMDFMQVFISRDFEYWAFSVFSEDSTVYYVGSASGAHTTQEIIQFFDGLVPNYQST